MREIIEKPVVFESTKGGMALWGVLSLPKSREKVPAVIAVHGFGGTKSKRKFVGLGRAFTQNGIAVLRFDFSGCGDSESELKNLSVRQEVKDLESAFNFLIRQPEIDKKKSRVFRGKFRGVDCLSLPGKQSSRKSFSFSCSSLRPEKFNGNLADPRTD